MTMHETHADDLIGAYVLDAVGSAERDLVEAHLSECKECRSEVTELREAAVHLSAGHEVAPPTELRSRILGAINAPTSVTDAPSETAASRTYTDSADSRREPTSSPRALTNKSVWGLAAAGLLAVGGWGIWQNVAGDLSPIDEVIQASDAQTYTTQYEGETVTVVSSSSVDRAVLRAGALPDLDEGQTYQAWWVGADENITSAGLISSDRSAAELEIALEGDPENVAAFALSVEPAGGSPQPTTDPVVIVPLS